MTVLITPETFPSQVRRATVRPDARQMPQNLPRETGWRPYPRSRTRYSMLALRQLRGTA